MNRQHACSPRSSLPSPTPPTPPSIGQSVVASTMLLQPSSPSSFLAFSPSRVGPSGLHQRACGSSSVASSSSSPTSPFTSPSRPAGSTSVRRQLDFGGSPVRFRTDAGRSGHGSHVGDERDRKAEEAMSVDVDELSTSFQGSSFLSRPPPSTHSHALPDPTSPTPSSARKPKPIPATWTLPLATSPSASPSASSTCSPTTSSQHTSRIPVLVKKPQLVRRPAFQPTQAHTPASFIPSYSQRVAPSPAPSSSAPARAPPPPASLSSSTSAAPAAHQQIARLRTSVSLSSPQKPPAPIRSPLLSMSLNGATSTPMYSPTFSDDAKPSPDAFKVSLMKKSGSSSSAGSLSHSLRKGLVSPPTPNSKTPLHFDLSPHLPSSSSSRLKDNLPFNSSTTSSPASSNSSPTNSFASLASPRSSAPRQRTSYFSSSLINASASSSSTSSSTSTRPLTSSNLSASPTDPHPLRAFTLSRPSALSASSSSGSSTTGRGGWTPVKPTRLFFGVEDDESVDPLCASPPVDDGRGEDGGRQRRRTNDQPPSEPHQLGLGLGLGLPMELQPARPLSAASSWRSGWEEYRSPHPQQPTNRRVRTSSGLKRKGSGFALEGAFGGMSKSEGGEVAGRGRRRSAETIEEDVLSARFELVEKLGSGDGGVVWKVEERSTGLVGAVKVGRKWGGERERFRLMEELSILQTLSADPASSAPHPNILDLTSAWTQSSRLHLHTPLYPLGDLATFLENLAPPDPLLPVAGLPSALAPTGGLDEVRTWKLLASLASALAHAHDLGIVHLDVKPSNVLVDADGEVKLGDWGYSARLTEGGGGASEVMPEREGDRDYLSAEGIRGVVSTAGDIFSLGLLLLESLANIVPPSGGSPFHRLRSNDFSDLEATSPPTPMFNTSQPTSPSSPFPTPSSSTSSYFSSSSPPLLTPSTPSFASGSTASWGSPEIVALVKQMMHSEPAYRPSAAGIMRSGSVKRTWEAMERGRNSADGIQARPTLVQEDEQTGFSLAYILGREESGMKGLEEGFEGMLARRDSGSGGGWEMEC